MKQIISEKVVLLYNSRKKTRYRFYCLYNAIIKSDLLSLANIKMLLKAELRKDSKNSNLPNCLWRCLPKRNYKFTIRFLSIHSCQKPLNNAIATSNDYCETSLIFQVEIYLVAFGK